MGLASSPPDLDLEADLDSYSVPYLTITTGSASAVDMNFAPAQVRLDAFRPITVTTGKFQPPDNCDLTR